MQEFEIASKTVDISENIVQCCLQALILVRRMQGREMLSEIDCVVEQNSFCSNNTLSLTIYCIVYSISISCTKDQQIPLPREF